VTGGAAGIGAAIAGAYAAKGARIAFVDLNEAAATQTASGLPTESRGFRCDVADPDSVRGTVDAVLDVFGRVDILVNSAGVVQLAPAEELSVKAWNATIDVNLKGTFLMCQAVGSSMLQAGGGVIVNMASQAATVALDQHVAYCASKFGVVGVSKVLAAEWGPRGVRVNTISPTVVLTELGRRRGTAHTVMRSRSSSPSDDSPIRTRSLRPQCIWGPTPRRWSTAPTWLSGLKVRGERRRSGQRVSRCLIHVANGSVSFSWRIFERARLRPKNGCTGNPPYLISPYRQ
jgi:NAD(P)-dependent dehydrogenase (short-subunit alcohol dehydrogenase family)